MKINEIVIDRHFVCVPSDWVEIKIFNWPGRLHPYRIWQHINVLNIFPEPFNFDHIYDPGEQKTWASALHMPTEKWDLLPLPRSQIRFLTAPKAMAKQLLPRKEHAPFTLLAYRFSGGIELCAYRQGLLQHTERSTQKEVSALWARVVQTMPVLAAAPLYSTEESLTQLFKAHHGVCHTLPQKRSKVWRFFMEHA